MKIHIIGGGIGGMSAALHLGRLVAQRHLPHDTSITVYEASNRLGGKAASQFARIGGSGRWPGEHGFRFFPNFYRSIVDTLRYIPVTAEHRAKYGINRAEPDLSVYDLLVSCPQAGVAMNGNLVPFSRATGLTEFGSNVVGFLRSFGLPNGDSVRFAAEVLRFLLMSHDRALVEYEHKTLRQLFADADDNLWRFLGSLRALSAMRSDAGSARTLLFTALQMMADFDTEFSLTDAILPGPTDWMMLEPWQAELIRLGVGFEFGHRLERLSFAPATFGTAGQLKSFTVRRADGQAMDIDVSGGDAHVVLAVPYEAAYRVLSDAENRPSVFDRLLSEYPQGEDNLGMGSEPMVGVQFWLSRREEVVRGHVLYPTLPWAMTSVSQGQFWRETFDRELDDLFEASGLQSVWSTIISAWEQPGLDGHPPPSACTREQIAKQAFKQITSQLGRGVKWSDVIGYHVDTDIAFSRDGAHCTTPLWVSPAGSFEARPPPDPGCRNFFIAADWARTETDVGSMESADEAARLAVAGIAAEAPFPVDSGALPRVRPMRFWPAVDAMRETDRWLYHRGLPNPIDLPRTARRGVIGWLRRIRDGAPALDYFTALDELGQGLPEAARLVEDERDDSTPVSARGHEKVSHAVGVDDVLTTMTEIDKSGREPEDDDGWGLLDRLASRLNLLQ